LYTSQKKQFYQDVIYMLGIITTDILL
jgi:hypothetical protein